MTDDRFETNNDGLEGAADLAGATGDALLASAGEWLLDPVRSIKGIAAALADSQANDPAIRRDFLGKIDAAAARLEKRIARLLDLAAIRSGAFRCAAKPLNLRAVVRKAYTSFGERRAMGRLLLRLPRQDCPVLGDADRLRLAVEILIENAINFSPLDSTVTLKLEMGEADAVVYVKDEGPGIEEKWLGDIFEPFFKVPGRKAGADAGIGAGLAVAKAIFEAHGAKWGVDSRKGVGSVFWFKLPLS